MIFAKLTANAPGAVGLLTVIAVGEDHQDCMRKFAKYLSMNNNVIKKIYGFDPSKETQFRLEEMDATILCKTYITDITSASNLSVLKYFDGCVVNRMIMGKKVAIKPVGNARSSCSMKGKSLYRLRQKLMGTRFVISSSLRNALIQAWGITAPKMEIDVTEYDLTSLPDAFDMEDYEK